MTAPLALRVVVAADAVDYKKGARLCRGLCRKVVHRFAQGATALRAEGCGLPLCGNAYKVSVTGLVFCII